MRAILATILLGTAVGGCTSPDLSLNTYRCEIEEHCGPGWVCARAPGETIGICVPAAGIDEDTGSECHGTDGCPSPEGSSSPDKVCSSNSDCGYGEVCVLSMSTSGGGLTEEGCFAQCISACESQGGGSACEGACEVQCGGSGGGSRGSCEEDFPSGDCGGEDGPGGTGGTGGEVGGSYRTGVCAVPPSNNGSGSEGEGGGDFPGGGPQKCEDLFGCSNSFDCPDCGKSGITWCKPDGFCGTEADCDAYCSQGKG